MPIACASMVQWALVRRITGRSTRVATAIIADRGAFPVIGLEGDFDRLKRSGGLRRQGPRQKRECVLRAQVERQIAHWCPRYRREEPGTRSRWTFLPVEADCELRMLPPSFGSAARRN